MNSLLIFCPKVLRGVLMKGRVKKRTMEIEDISDSDLFRLTSEGREECLKFLEGIQPSALGKNFAEGKIKEA